MVCWLLLINNKFLTSLIMFLSANLLSAAILSAVVPFAFAMSFTVSPFNDMYSVAVFFTGLLPSSLPACCHLLYRVLLSSLPGLLPSSLPVFVVFFTGFVAIFFAVFLLSSLPWFVAVFFTRLVVVFLFWCLSIV